MSESLRDERPGLAIIANCITPYRIHLHTLIAAGIPEFKLHTLITRGDADFKWAVRVPEPINVAHFARAGETPSAGIFQSPYSEWRKGGQLIQHLRTNAVQAVICFGHNYGSHLRIIQHCYRRGIPVFVNNDSNIRGERQLSRLAAWGKRRVYAWWLKRATGVMPMGELGEEFFLKYGADRTRFYRVPYTPDYDDFAAFDAERLDQFRKRFGLSGGRRYLLFSGRLAPVKRVDLLIDAFANLAAERPDWDLLIAGDGPLGEDLRRRVPEGMRERVTWTGFLEQEELKLAYHAADVLVLPSDREPWAVVVQEAMAAGLVVVASEVVGAAHELIVDQDNGRIVPKADVHALQQAILDVTQADRLGRYKARSQSALKTWRETHDPVKEIRRALRDAGVLAD
jgi:glycosyltransferase involved in cell wall biosynthesis